MMVVAVILITVVFEVVTHALDHYAEHVPHIFQIVQRVYKELMLLGIISFGLFFFESSFCLPPEFTHELHVIHILIFYISIMYIAEAIFILYVAGAVARRWTKIESISLMQYAGLKLQLAAITQRLEQRNVVLRYLSWLLLYKQHAVRAQAAYQDARLQFVSCNRCAATPTYSVPWPLPLSPSPAPHTAPGPHPRTAPLVGPRYPAPPRHLRSRCQKAGCTGSRGAGGRVRALCGRLPHDFNFALYLRRCIRKVFVDLLHIHWGIWLAVALLVQVRALPTAHAARPTTVAPPTTYSSGAVRRRSSM